MILSAGATLYSLVLLVCVFGGGSIIRLYGDSCGLSLMDPSSWFSSMIMIGSPWCRGLNWLGYISTTVVENIWYHALANAITWGIAKVPILNSDIVGRKPSDNSINGIGVRRSPRNVDKVE